MTIRANFQKNFLMRYLIVSLVCLFLGAWFGYDGMIGYPRQLEVARAYEALQDLESEERRERWKAITSERGWSDRIPSKQAHEWEEGIPGQYFWACLNLLIGIPALVLYIRSRGSWVASTETGLTTSWGQSLNFADVTRLNKKKWANKGIAKATYMVDGSSKTFTFDDFKFEREPIGQMLRNLEEGLSPEQIVGGPPESASDSAEEAESAKAPDADNVLDPEQRD